MLAGCDGAASNAKPADGAEPATAGGGGMVGCLPVVWQAQAGALDERRRAYDRLNDEVRGGSVSCATGTGASEFASVLQRLRKAAATGERAEVAQEFAVPLLYIDAAGERRQLRDDSEIAAQLDEMLSPAMLALLARLDLAGMEVVPGQGGFFELGAVWLAPAEPGGRPAIVTLNRQALDEAAAAPAQ